MTIAILPMVYSANLPIKNFSYQNADYKSTISFAGNRFINKSNALKLFKGSTKVGEYGCYICGAAWLGLAASVEFFGADHSFVCQEAEKIFHLNPRWVTAISCFEGVADFGKGALCRYAGDEGVWKFLKSKAKNLKIKLKTSAAQKQLSKRKIGKSVN